MPYFLYHTKHMDKRSPAELAAIKVVGSQEPPVKNSKWTELTQVWNTSWPKRWSMPDFCNGWGEGQKAKDSQAHWIYGGLPDHW